MYVLLFGGILAFRDFNNQTLKRLPREVQHLFWGRRNEHGLSDILMGVVERPELQRHLDGMSSDIFKPQADRNNRRRVTKDYTFAPRNNQSRTNADTVHTSVKLST